MYVHGSGEHINHSGIHFCSVPDVRLSYNVPDVENPFKSYYIQQPHSGKLILSFSLIQHGKYFPPPASYVDFNIFLCTFTASDPPGSHLTEV